MQGAPSGRPSSPILHFSAKRRIEAAVLLTATVGAHSQSEERWFTLRVSSQGRLLAVAHTYTATGVASARVRIISAREATRSERQQYENIPR